MGNFYVDLDELLESGQKVVVARIIERKGSAPRSVGAKCGILESGEIRGTIGGGLLEYQVMEKAKAVFRTGQSAKVHFELAGEDVADTDMLCGGMVDVFLEPVFPDNQPVRDIVAQIRALVMSGNIQGLLLTLIADGIAHDRPDRQSLIIKDGSDVRVIGPLAAGLNVDPAELIGIQRPALKPFKNKDMAVFVEPIQAADILYIFGAGHISTFVSPLAKLVGFGVVVIDDREEFANKKRFPEADEIMVMPLSRSFDRIKLTPSSYIAIVTRGHMHDYVVLKEALKQKCAYIGMVGSKRKREKIYQTLMEEGTRKEILQKVHSPIGLAIGAETPEEIAVSIVAELIQERDRLKIKAD